MADVYRGRIRIFTFDRTGAPGGWHHAEIAKGFITLAPSYSPNQHFELLPEDALLLGFEAVTAEDPRVSRHVTIGDVIACPKELRRCKSTRFGRIACTLERDVLLMDTLDEDVLCGWLCDYDDLSEE